MRAAMLTVLLVTPVLAIDETSKLIVIRPAPGMDAGPFIRDPGVTVLADASEYLLAATADLGLPVLRAPGVRVTLLGAVPVAADDLYVANLPAPAFLEELGRHALLLYAAERTAVIRAVPEAAAEISALAHEGRHGFCGALVKILFDEIALPAAPEEPLPPAAAAPDPRVQALVAQVVEANLVQTDTDLSAFFNRRADAQGGRDAQTYLVGRYNALGGRLQVTTHNYNASYHHNVIVTLPGLVNPGRIWMLGGHYDSTAGSPTTRAPGADDDASGSATVLEVCRILSSQRFEDTIMFAAWGAEEQGLVGSGAYAALARGRGDDIRGYVTFDMTSYVRPNDPLRIYFVTQNTTPAQNTELGRILTDYTTTPFQNGSLTAGTSDHQSFFSRGYVASFPFENPAAYSPYIHTTNDAIPQSANSFAFAKEFGKLGVAWLAEKARLYDGLALNHAPLGNTSDNTLARAVTVTILAEGGLQSAFVRWRNSTSGFTTVPLTATGNPNEYRAMIPAQPWGTTVDYYVEATNGASLTKRLPDTAPGTTYSYLTSREQRLFFDNLEVTGLWTHGASRGTDDWQQGPPNQNGVNANDPPAAWSPTRVWGTDLFPSGFNGNYPNNTTSWLESPAIDCSGQTSVRLRYRRWLSVESGQFDQADIKVNGTQVWVNASTGNLLDSSWVLHEVDISGPAAGNPATRLRYGLNTDGGTVFGGWNVDDVEVYAPGAPPSITPSTATPAPGATVGLALFSPVAAGHVFLLAISGGTAPGLALDANRIVPLNPDALFTLSWSAPSVFVGFAGTLDGTGRSSQPELRLPAVPELSGLVFYVSGVTASGPAITDVFPAARIAVQ
jgi:Zn-dependent M28 family amino/carboxypeptidase